MKSRKIITGSLIALVLCLLVAAFSSELPDGMEIVMEKLGISSRQQQTASSPDFYPLPEYRFPRINSPIASTALAALAGMAIVFVVVLAVGTLLRKYKVTEKRKNDQQLDKKG